MLGVDNVLDMNESVRVRNLQKLIERCYKCLDRLVVNYSLPLSLAIPFIREQIKVANELPIPPQYLRAENDVLIETSKYPLAPIIRDIFTILNRAVLESKTVEQTYNEIVAAMDNPRVCTQVNCAECTRSNAGNNATCTVKGEDALDQLHMMVQAPMIEHTRSMLITLIEDLKQNQDAEDINDLCLDIHDSRCQFDDVMDGCCCYDILKDGYLHFLSCQDPTCAFCTVCRIKDMGGSTCEYMFAEFQYATRFTQSKTCPAIVNGCLNPECKFCPDINQPFKVYLDKAKTGKSLEELSAIVLAQRQQAFQTWVASPVKVIKPGWFTEEYEKFLAIRPVSFYRF